MLDHIRSKGRTKLIYYYQCADDGVVNITSDNNVGAITPDILHTAKLVVFDPAHPEPDSGQLLIAPDMKYSNLKLKVKKVGC